MYWSNQEVDNTIYPPRSNRCEGTKWLDYDCETGLAYCHFCGWTPDNADYTVSTSAG